MREEFELNDVKKKKKKKKHSSNKKKNSQDNNQQNSEQINEEITQNSVEKENVDLSADDITAEKEIASAAFVEETITDNNKESETEKADSNDKKTKKKKEKKIKNPRPKAKKITFVLAILMCLVLFLCLCGGIGALIFADKLLEDKPELNVEDLVAPDSSVIYDAEGNKIMEIGMYLRENIDYQQMPNCLIDAILSIEDSRFFEHPGFDLPRFTKAAIENLRSGGFDQGGSTITMQLIKNTYYTIDADNESTIASREGMSGLKRKAQEIVLSMQLTVLDKIDRRRILALYLNKVNYGNNIRGVEKASQYYFGKSASQLNLSESAFLAGLINSPNSYNPYNNLYKYDNEYLSSDIDYLKNGTERRNEVIDLMLYHGYISQEEADLAKSIKLEDELCGVDVSFSEVNEKYQGYIDAVIDEIIEVTGESPYKVGMEIHTNMNPYMQEYIYDLQNEASYTGLKFPNKLCQSAIVLMNNQTGAIEALGGGRGEADSARSFNRATSAYLNPGSSIKPVIDYALAFEALGWATSHTITDQPYYLYNGNILVSNYDHTYHGDMLITEALGRSQNTPAVQALAAVVEEKGEEYVVDYLNSIGFDFDYEDFDLQFAIGGNRCLVTPLQLAGAHAIFMNGGRYIKPHTVDYIVYNGTRENYVADTKGIQAISEATAWMTQYLEYYNMYGSFSSLMWYCKKDYPLYGKTGTTDWGDAGVSYGIPVGATKDSWLLMQTNKYTISCWTGYDELAEGAYFSNSEYQDNTKSKIVDRILDEIETHHLGEYDPYKENPMPESVVEIKHIKGAYPYAYPDGAHGNVTGYISKKVLDEKPLVSVSEALEYSKQTTKYVKAGVSGISGVYDGNGVFVTFSVGSGSGGLLSGESVDLSTTNFEGETTHAAGRIYFPHWITVYTGVALPPYDYTVSCGDQTIVGTTWDTAFSEAISGGASAKVCVGPSGQSQSCVSIPLSQ